MDDYRDNYNTDNNNSDNVNGEAPKSYEFHDRSSEAGPKYDGRYSESYNNSKYNTSNNTFDGPKYENRYSSDTSTFDGPKYENRYSSDTSTFDGPKYDNRYAADRSYMDAKPERKKRAKKEKGERKSGGFFRKAVACVALGALFGSAAAGSFYAIDTYLLPEEKEVVSQTDLNVAKLQETVASLQQSMYTNTSSTSSMVVTDVTTVVDKVMPSMVAVNNLGQTTYSDWFGRRYTEDTESCGSGIIIGESDTEYFIATNHHVIDKNISLSVVFADTTTAEAYVKGYDSSMDIAVIAVAKDTLTTETKAAIAVAEIGDSESLKIGEPAIAIGNALGYGQSVTTGVVSAIDRSISIEETTFEHLIQTSAAINPGNSGGALLNIQGQVIGINSSKVGGSQIEGVGFAIPINEVKDIIGEFSQRETKLKVKDSERGYLGIASNENYDLTSLGFPAGVYVMKVYEGSPAEAAGLFEGDIITKANGQSVSTITELSDYLSYYKHGETVTLSVTRRVDGALTSIELDVVLGTKSDAIKE